MRLFQWKIGILHHGWCFAQPSKFASLFQFLHWFPTNWKSPISGLNRLCEPPDDSLCKLSPLNCVDIPTDSFLLSNRSDEPLDCLSLIGICGTQIRLSTWFRAASSATVDLGAFLSMSCWSQNPPTHRGENSRIINGTYTVRGGSKWLNMDYLLRRCWLLTARIDRWSSNLALDLRPEKTCRRTRLLGERRSNLHARRRRTAAWFHRYAIALRRCTPRSDSDLSWICISLF